MENGDTGDVSGLRAAVAAAQAVTDKPSLIKVRTTIGLGSKNQGTEKVHGSPLGAADLAAVKAKVCPAISRGRARARRSQRMRMWRRC